MPEGTETITTPAPETTQATGGGIDALMTQLDAAAAAEKAAPAPPITTTGTTPATPPEPDAEAEAAAAAAAAAAAPGKPGATPAAEPEPDWSKAPPKWTKIYEGHKAKTRETISSLESKIAALEKKPFESAGDANKMAILEQQLAAQKEEFQSVKKKLAEQDFSQSDDYKNLQKQATATYKEAIDLVGQLKVTNEDGTTRDATKADFDRIRTLPFHMRKAAANELFGDYATEVLGFARDVDKFHAQAKQMAAEHAESHDARMLEKEQTERRNRDAHDQHFKASLEAIKANPSYGKYFSEDPNDPEASKVLRESYEEIERVTAQMDKLPPEQKAAFTAVLHARAAAAPRLIMQHARLAKEMEALKAELAKYRETDPGTRPASGGGATTTGTTAARGIEGAAAAFDSDPSLVNRR